MTRNAAETRDRILDSARELILDGGLVGASIERIVDAAGITKGAFFYHFEDKDDLILSLVTRFAEEDRKQLLHALERMERMSSDDPLQRLLLFVGIFIDQFSDLDEPYPGCLYAAYLYQKGMISSASMVVVRNAMLLWRKKIAELVQDTAKRYPPKKAVTPEVLADLFSTTIEGAFIMAKTLEEPRIVAEHLKHYRRYLELLFTPESAQKKGYNLG